MNLKTDFSPGVGKNFQTLLLRVLATAILLATPASSRAINASPKPVDLVQPDGTRIRLSPKGDEYAHWFEDVNGFAVVRNGRNYVYAQRRGDGGLAPTTFMVGRDDARALNLEQHLRPSAQFINGARRSLTRRNGATVAPSAIAPIQAAGNVKNLVILCRFADHTLGVHTRPPADYDVLMNTTGGSPTVAPSGSLKDFYREASYGTVTLDSTVVAWVTLPQTEAYYCDGLDGFGTYPQNAQRMVMDALNAADSIVNFGEFDRDNDGFVDAIDIIHSGYGAETGGGDGDWIWSHKWSLSDIPGGMWTSGDRNANNVLVKVFDYHTEPALWDVSGTAITRVGVIAHETGHFFGLPDLYDTDDSSEGIGSYCLMANSWGFDGSQYHPPHPSAWAKIQLGWVTPTTLVAGTYNVPRAETLPVAYKITNGYPSGEYLLIENRQSIGFEQMPQGGLCIWHIDDTVDGNTDEGFPTGLGWPGAHYQVALLQADGLYQLERGLNRGDAGDVYRGGNGGVSSISGVTVPDTQSYQSGFLVPTANIITNISFSASNMTFTFTNPNVRAVSGVQIVAVASALVSESCIPTNRAVDPGETVTVSYTLRNVGSANANVTATLLATNGLLVSSQPQNFGTLVANGASATRSFSYIASGVCGGTVTNTLLLQTGGTNIGLVSFTFPLGGQVTRFSQTFENLVSNSLPSGWFTDSSLNNGWVTTSDRAFAGTNSVFAASLGLISLSTLTTPYFVLSSSNCQLSFSHYYDFEYGFDGGVLEISINNEPFQDVLEAGCTFSTNGYRFPLDTDFGSPLGGRQAWTGTSTNFVTTVLTFPEKVANQNVRLRWRLASDMFISLGGWYIDSVVVTDRSCCPNSAPLVLYPRMATNAFTFAFNTFRGLSYVVEYKNELASRFWTPLRTDSGDNSPHWVTNSPSAQRFYRIRVP